MTTREHIIRLDRRISELWDRDVLEREMGKWVQVREQYLEIMSKHLSNGGRANKNHVIVFLNIVPEAIKRIKATLVAKDLLESVS